MHEEGDYVAVTTKDGCYRGFLDAQEEDGTWTVTDDDGEIHVGVTECQMELVNSPPDDLTAE